MSSRNILFRRLLKEEEIGGEAHHLEDTPRWFLESLGFTVKFLSSYLASSSPMDKDLFAAIQESES